MCAMKVLVTCPPMLGMKDHFLPIFESFGIEAVCPDVRQTLSENELIGLLPGCDGWIIGDDPATAKVFEVARKGGLKAAVKWGIGVDNVDFDACHRLGIKIANTPDMFGREVADVALGYVIGLARYTFLIDREIREGGWPKNRGVSLSGKCVGVVGLGDIGSNVVKRLLACDMDVIAWDPGVSEVRGIESLSWPERIDACDFLIFTCSLNAQNYHMLNSEILSSCKRGVRIINVARGGLVDERALCDHLKSGHVHSVALDVFEHEPLPADSPLRDFPMNIFGSHNSSNTSEAVMHTNQRVIDKLVEFLCER